MLSRESLRGQGSGAGEGSARVGQAGRGQAEGDGLGGNRPGPAGQRPSRTLGATAVEEETALGQALPGGRWYQHPTPRNPAPQHPAPHPCAMSPYPQPPVPIPRLFGVPRAGQGQAGPPGCPPVSATGRPWWGWRKAAVGTSGPIISLRVTAGRAPQPPGEERGWGQQGGLTLQLPGLGTGVGVPDAGTGGSGAAGGHEGDGMAQGVREKGWSWGTRDMGDTGARGP